MKNNWTDVFEEHLKKERERINHHGPQCFAPWGKCISCGCQRTKGQACLSHKGEDSYKNYLLERIAIAQEKLAGINNEK